MNLTIFIIIVCALIGIAVFTIFQQLFLIHREIKNIQKNHLKKKIWTH